MASGRPRRRNDPSIMASVETAVSTVARPSLPGWLWHWRYELALATGLPAAAAAIGVTLGPAWLAAVAVTAAALLIAALAWPPARRRLIARAWCVITPHRVRTGCAHAWVQTRDGRLPVILHTTPAGFGERVLLWCRAGITAGDLEGARDILQAACWASDVRVVPNERRRHLVLLEVVRHPAPPPAARPVTPSWPHRADRAEADDADPGEPARPAGLTW
jgi:hypothetical protein